MPSETDPRTVRVSELFYSLQGESRFAGQPCAFVRLAGCPLRCVWCDSKYTWPRAGEIYTLDQVLAQVRTYGVPLVEVTGGEPLAQRATRPLLAALCDAGYTVLLETSGAYDLRGVDPRVIIILDCKPPGSGESHRQRWSNLERLKPGVDEVKFVILNRADYEWSRQVVRERDLPARFRVVFSPAAPPDEPFSWEQWSFPRALAGWILADRLPVVLQLQLHRLLWPEQTRGV